MYGSVFESKPIAALAAMNRRALPWNHDTAMRFTMPVRSWGDENYASISCLFVGKSRLFLFLLARLQKPIFRSYPVTVRSGEKPLQPIRKQKNGIN
jgi:hypothetical protein